MPNSGPRALDIPLIKPVQLFKKVAVQPQALIVFSPSDLQFFLSRGDLALEKTQDLRFTVLRTVRVDHHVFTLAGPAIGAPLAVMLTEVLISFGATQIIALGSCGSLSERARIGDLVIPWQAYSDEGTSSHYPLKGTRVTASRLIFGGLRTLCQTRKQNWITGNVWTTDAPFRETAQKVKKFQEKQAIAVEMELSALFKAGTFYGVDAGALLVVSDELFGRRWRSGNGQPAYREALAGGAEIVFQLLKNLG